MVVNWGSALLWGFIATVILTTVTDGARGVGVSRMSIPFILGTMFTADRYRAAAIGVAVHMLNGWLFAFPYVFIFESLHRATWWLGAIMGLAHGLVLLVAVMPMLPGIHPRMASELRGPEPTRELEPPGFMGFHYGRGTPLVALAGHVAYGAVLGAFYHLASR